MSDIYLKDSETCTVLSHLYRTMCTSEYIYILTRNMLFLTPPTQYLPCDSMYRIYAMQIDNAVYDRQLCLRTDTVFGADVGLITGLVELLFNYEYEWLTLGLYAVCGVQYASPETVCRPTRKHISSGLSFFLYTCVRYMKYQITKSIFIHMSQIYEVPSNKNI